MVSDSRLIANMIYIVFDQPHVANLEVGENLEIVGGNIFEAIPPADAILLKWILHDWSDEEFAGKERNEKEWEKLFLAAGFTHYKITPALGLRSLIEVYP
ncbi:unnamed protein product, partial [Vitis vinifera]